MIDDANKNERTENAPGDTQDAHSHEDQSLEHPEDQDERPPELTSDGNGEPRTLISVETAGVKHQAPALQYPVVGFGASAGGLQALKEVLENLDPNTGMASRNTSKHAGKTHVKVTLTGEGDRLQLKVMDFGIGFDQEANTGGSGLGLISMQERARLVGGTLTINSRLGEGTTVVADVPVHQDA